MNSGNEGPCSFVFLFRFLWQGNLAFPYVFLHLLELFCSSWHLSLEIIQAHLTRTHRKWTFVGFKQQDYTLQFCTHKQPLLSISGHWNPLPARCYTHNWLKLSVVDWFLRDKTKKFLDSRRSQTWECIRDLLCKTTLHTFWKRRTFFFLGGYLRRIFCGCYPEKLRELDLQSSRHGIKTFIPYISLGPFNNKLDSWEPGASFLNIWLCNSWLASENL